MDYENYKRKNPKIGTVTKEGVIVGRGANKRVVPTDEVYKLAALGCTMEEMSEWFQVNRETLKYNFMDLINKGRAETKQNLRRAQLKLAMEGNATMLIWLGKNLLSQSENGNSNSSVEPLPWVD